MPTYRDQEIPIFSFKPDWSNEVNLVCLYHTIIREALDNSEERHGRRPRCLYGIKFQTMALRGQETGYLRRFLELAQAMPIGMPVWTDECRLLQGISEGATTLSVEDTTVTLFGVLADYALIWRAFNDWEVVEIDEIEEDAITLSEPTVKAFPAGSMVVPLLFGKLPRANLRQPTDDKGAFQVEFEERFNGITDQSIVETSTPELEWEFNSECQNELVLRFSMPEGETWRVQIAESLEGPWGNHIWASITGDEAEAGVKELVLNNDYSGTHYFRVVDQEGVLRRSAVLPAAAVLAAPTLNSISNCSVPEDRAMFASEGFVYAYSDRENDMISPDEVYLVPRGRYEHVYAAPFTSADIVAVPDISAPEGAIIKWTRDGSDPTENTVMPMLDGVEENISPSRPDFRFILKIRCFKDGCASPVTTILLDRRINILARFNSTGVGNVAAGFCDLPRDEDDAESGFSCNLNYGGTQGLADAMEALAKGSATSSNGGLLVYKNFGAESNGIYLGWENFQVAWSYYNHQGSEISAESIWALMRPCFTFAYAHCTNDTNPDATYFQPDEFGSTITGAGGGTGLTFMELALDDYILSTQPEDDGSNSLEQLELVLTVHHDFVELSAGGYVPPETDPEPPIVVPENTIYGDDFEAYADDDDLSGDTLEEGTGWDGPWVIHEYVSTDPGDDFESYGADDDDVTTATALAGGEGWAAGSVWTVHDYNFNRAGGDDFESYSDDEEVTIVELFGGESWEEGSFWIVYDYAGQGGGDDFESYSDGELTDGTSDNLNGGTGWNKATAVEDWVVHDWASKPPNATAYRYWRIEILNNNGDTSFTGILEVELRETNGGTNYALASNGGSASASLDNTDGPAAEAIDGSLSSLAGWICPNNNAWPQHIDIDLGSARTITEVKLGSYSTTNTTAARSIHDAVIYGSNDGSTWTPIKAIWGETNWTFGELRTFNI